MKIQLVGGPMDGRELEWSNDSLMDLEIPVPPPLILDAQPSSVGFGKVLTYRRDKYDRSRYHFIRERLR